MDGAAMEAYFEDQGRCSVMFIQLFAERLFHILSVKFYASTEGGMSGACE